MKLEDITDWQDVRDWIDENHRGKRWFYDDLVHKWNDYALGYTARGKKPVETVKLAFSDLKQYLIDEGWKKNGK